MAPKRDESPSSPTRNSDKYIHVHLYEGGRWGAWVREPKAGGKRLFLGTHLTERLAARCQDRALLKMERGSKRKAKLNFDREDYKEDEHLRNSLTTAEFLKYLRGESRETYKTYTPTPCLLKFRAEEEASGNLKPEETRLAIAAPKPTSKGTSKLSKPTVPKSTNLKPKNKKRTFKDNYFSDEEEFNHYPSASEGEGEGEDEDEDEDEELMGEDLQTTAYLARVAHADNPEQLASVAAPVTPSLTGTRKRQSTLRTQDDRQYTLVTEDGRRYTLVTEDDEALMKDEELTKDAELTKDEALTKNEELTKDEKEVLEALLMLATGPPKRKIPRHEEY